MPKTLKFKCCKLGLMEPVHGTGMCKLPFTSASTGLNRIQYLKTKMVKFGILETSTDYC
jgi:hypothetical protein